MSTSDGEMDDEKMNPSWEAQFKFQEIYHNRGGVLGSVILDNTQKKQFKVMVNVMRQYEEARGVVLNERQQYIFLEIYIQEPLTVARCRKVTVENGKKRPPGRLYHDDCYTKPMSLESDNDVDVLCFALERCLCAKVEDLSLDGVKISSIGSANIEKIANAVAKHKSLVNFSWREADFEEVTSIAKAFSTQYSLETLNLDGNNIGDSGAQELASMLVKNNSMKELHLNDNVIGDAGAKTLAQALAHNKHFKTLKLRGNKLDESTAKHFVPALLQNHMCNVDLIPESLNDMEEDHAYGTLSSSREYHCAVKHLNEINDKEAPTATKAYEKAIRTRTMPKNLFEAFWLPALLEVDEKIVLQLWEDALGSVDDGVLHHVIRKRNAIDLIGGVVAAVEPDGSGSAIQNQIKQRDEYSAQLKKIKTEILSAEDSLSKAKEDIEDANELVQQQSVFTDKWQGKFDDIAKLAEEAGVDLQKINQVRYR